MYVAATSSSGWLESAIALFALVAVSVTAAVSLLARSSRRSAGIDPATAVEDGRQAQLAQLVSEGSVAPLLVDLAPDDQGEQSAEVSFPDGSVLELTGGVDRPLVVVSEDFFRISICLRNLGSVAATVSGAELVLVDGSIRSGLVSNSEVLRGAKVRLAFSFPVNGIGLFGDHGAALTVRYSDPGGDQQLRTEVELAFGDPVSGQIRLGRVSLYRQGDDLPFAVSGAES